MYDFEWICNKYRVNLALEMSMYIGEYDYTPWVKSISDLWTLTDLQKDDIHEYIEKNVIKDQKVRSRIEKGFTISMAIDRKLLKIRAVRIN